MGTLINQVKFGLIERLIKTVEKLGLSVPPQLFNSTSQFISVSYGGKGKSDLIVNLSNPVFSAWYDDLDSIGQLLILSSPSNELSFSDYKVIGKTLHFNLNRSAAISNILFGNCQADYPDFKKQPVLICNLAKDNLKELTQLRFKYIEETVIRLLKLTGCDIKTINSNPNQHGDNTSNTQLTSTKIKQFDNQLIDIKPFSSLIPFNLEESEFTIENGTRLSDYLQLFNKLLSSDDLKMNKIIILIHINEWKVAEKALIAWSILSSTIDYLNQASFIPIADIISDLSLLEIKDSLKVTIEEQSETQYPQDQVDCLIDTSLRYMIISISPKVFHKLDLIKHKEALFVQYNYARLVSVTRKFNQNCNTLPQDQINLDFLKGNQEWNLIYNYIAKYPNLLVEVIQSNPMAVHKIPVFLKNFVNDISLFYNSTRIITEINDKSLPLINSRIVLIEKIKNLMCQTLHLIGVEPVQYM